MGNCLKFASVALMGMAICAPTIAQAQWFAKSTGPDVFGNISVKAMTIDPNMDGLLVSCNQKNALKLVYLLQATQAEVNELSSADAPSPSTLLIKVDSNPVLKLQAEMRPWNTKYIGIVASGRIPNILSVVNEIGGAQQKISVGVEVGGTQQSDTFGVFGSTHAMAKVKDDCKLGKISKKQAAGSPAANQ